MLIINSSPSRKKFWKYVLAIISISLRSSVSHLSSYCILHIKFLCCFCAACLWKKVVFLSPRFNQSTLALCSQYPSFSIPKFSWIFVSIRSTKLTSSLSASNNVTNFEDNDFFLPSLDLQTCLAHCSNPHFILFNLLKNSPSGYSQILFTSIKNDSSSTHHASNLKSFCILSLHSIFVSTNKGQ